MSKKLLNESTIRRFAGLAGIGADVVSNFINEAYGEDEEKMEEEVVSEEETISEEEEAEEEAEEEVGMMDMDADADADEEEAEEEADMEMDMEMDAEDEGGEDAEALVSDIVAKLQDLAKMAGVDIDVEMGDDEDLDEMKYKRDEETMEEGEEETQTLEELINGILEEEEADSNFGKFGDENLTPQEKKVFQAAMERGDDPQQALAMFRQDQEDQKSPSREKKAPRRNPPVKPIRRMEEEVVQEVLRRVRERLAQKKEQ